jgi:predicted dehydrogenase
MNTMNTTRRRFLQTTATAVAATIVAPHVLGGPRHVAPSDKVNIGLVGAGGQGRTNIRALFQESAAQVVAVADPIDQFSLDAFYYKDLGGRQPVRAEIEKHYAEKTPNYRCAEYEDFRVMLEKEPAIDAVLCATPDHLHAYVSLIAMQAGKHVFCEKPLTHNVWEARRVAQVAKESGVATQMGNIGHSNLGIRLTCEWLWDGAIGAVREVHAWVGAHRWNKQLTGRPTETPPVPAGVNWDLWIGPREPRPYHPAYTPVTWRDFWDFGGGGLGDFGCHDLDAACWALELVAPTTIEARPAGNMDRDIVPHGEICYYEFGPRGDQPAVRVTWYDGGLQPPCPDELPRGSTLPGRGVLFIGDKGKMLCDGAGGRPRLLPYAKTAEYAKPAESIPRSKGHHRDWLDACQGGAPASANFEYGARLTELVLLGVASLRAGRKIYWDAPNMKAAEAPEVDAVLKESYRAGWEIA